MSEIQKDEATTGKKLPSHAKVVVIGGGVVGCSILFYLAKFGWKDVVLLERGELTSGSSWHAAGQIHTISSDPNISRLQSYTIDLYKEIEELSGNSVGLHITSHSNHPTSRWQLGRDHAQRCHQCRNDRQLRRTLSA